MAQRAKVTFRERLATHRALLILLVIYAFAYTDRQLIAILIEPIKRDFGMSDTQAGLLYGFAFVVFFSVLGVPIARRADRANRSYIVIASLAMFSAMTAACGWTTATWQLMLARIGVGIGEAGTNPASQSMISDLYSAERRSTAMAVYVLGLHVGIVFGFLVGGFIGQLLGWRATFLIIGAAGILMALATTRLLKEPQRRDASRIAADSKTMTIGAGVRRLWRSSAVRHLFAGATISNIAVTALLAWLPAVLMRSHGLSLSATGMLLAFVIGVLGGFGTLLGGTLADRLGARDPAWRLRCIVVAFLVAAPCWILVLLAQNSVVAVIAFCVAGALVAFHVGPSFAALQMLAQPELRAFAASLLVLLANLVGVGLGPLLVGALSDAWLERYGAHSLRAALLLTPPLFLWAAAHYEAASRSLAADLRSTDDNAVVADALSEEKVAAAT